MKRNVMTEWLRAMSRLTPAQGLAWTEALAPRPRDMPRFDVVGGARDPRALLRATRALALSENEYARSDDLARAILILQRNNRLLRARFGVDWAGAASVLSGEARRRGMSVASLARLLTAGLRRDARSAGEGGAL